jgi:hypothetical protein
MNRFSKENKLKYYLKKIRLPIVAFFILFFFFFDAIGSVDETTAQKQEEHLTTSLRRNITQCYAVEGTYPPSLDYIKENYGLTYDESILFIDYKFIGANIYPDITIIQLEE